MATTKTSKTQQKSDEFAVIETGGKQYLVSPGMKIRIEKIPAGKNGEVVFDKVLLRSSGKETAIGAPFLAGAAVTAKWNKDARAKKVIIARYHSKTRYRKKKGHRQTYTEVTITGIK